ncbi:tRNA (guanine(46)-N(7))-methyltransferase TrmB [Thalassotalea atypica]|uniref:tRNA (guanine(46)-N(7))-methyltransferase TrmB n=1 Tax=Thalassotalea atypica TaxID=2054316 RepID=UPI002573E00D|nr:SAM-dependent methyltransferase [Thalassotalea atypica]
MTEEHSSVGNSKAIESNQPGIHENLEKIVSKHLNHAFEKPYQAHTVEIFNQLDQEVQSFSGPVILDACCGVGQSTRILAKLNPDALVIGVDKSAHRINRNVEEHLPEELCKQDNYRLVRADLNDFYRLVAKAKWPVAKHYILYPNPWPKAKHVQRRWHGSAVFPFIVSIGEQLTLRSNWPLYLEEFQMAAKIAGREGQLMEVTDQAKSSPLTPFEAKYIASGQSVWQLSFDR